MQTYWIIIAGLKGAGKSTFLRNVADFTTLHDERDMTIITPQQEADVLAWLERTGDGAFDPDRAYLTPEEHLFTRWVHRITVGEIVLDEQLSVCFYEAPGTGNFDFMWRFISPAVYLGAIIVIDSTNHTAIRDASRLAAAFASFAPEPYVFAANKQDEPEALPAEDIRILLQILDGHLQPVIPCVAEDAASVRGALLALLELLRDSCDDGIQW